MEKATKTKTSVKMLDQSAIKTQQCNLCKFNEFMQNMFVFCFLFFKFMWYIYMIFNL